MKNFLLINIDSEIVDLMKIVELSEQYENTHINLIYLEQLKKENLINEIIDIFQDKKITFYSSIVENVKNIKSKKLDAHYVFVDEQILNDQKMVDIAKLDDEGETFWVITEKFNFKINKENLVKKLKKYNIPICFSFSGFLLRNKEQVNYEEIRNYIEDIKNNWSNPLFEKESNLYVSNWKENDCINSSEMIVKNLIMGVFGDYIMTETETTKKDNLKTLMKTKGCMDCEYFNACAERGLGIIIKDLQLKGCIGLKLL